MEKSLACIKNKLRLAIPDRDEIKKMIDFAKQSNAIAMSNPIKEGCILYSYPKFYLFEEQENDPELCIKATRYYTDKYGQNVLFFSSSCSQKAVRVCQKAMDKYFNDHSLSLKLHRNYPELRYYIDNEFSDFYVADITSRMLASYFFFNLTIGIAYGIEKLGFSPQMCNAIAGYILRNKLTRAASNPKSGVTTILTNDFHLTPDDESGYEMSSLTPDHNISIDWSTMRSIPDILSLTEAIKKVYQNTLRERDDIQINILYSLIDDLDEGVCLMKQNPLFSNPSDKKLLLFTESVIKSVQFFLRLKTEPLTILNTTVLNVYQSDLGKSYHSFLSLDQFKKIVIHLKHDLREELTSLSNNGKVIEIDFKNTKPVFDFLNSKIAIAEVELARYIENICVAIIDSGKKIMTQMTSVIFGRLAMIKRFLLCNVEKQIIHMKEIASFNQTNIGLTDNLLKNVIEKKIIPDFYSVKFNQLVHKVANLKHILELLKLACEGERRLNDHIKYFNIDIEIENCEECIHKYKIHVVI